MSSHPLHPAAVHWPIALLTVAYGTDILHASLHLLPKSVLSLTPHGAQLQTISYYALSAGLLSAVPAVATGVMEAARLMQREGSTFQPGTRTLKPKVKTLFVHAALNDLAILASAAYWWKRRGAGGAIYQPETWMLGLGAALGGLLLFAASLGGTLVYNYGTGMRIAKGKGKAQ